MVDPQEAEIDWANLWKEAEGPPVQHEDLALLGEIFHELDFNDDGLLCPSQLVGFVTIFFNITRAGFADDCDLDECMAEVFGEDGDGVSAADWVDFHAAVAAACSGALWRRALKECATVSRITHHAAIPEEQDSLTICMGSSGAICTKWFSNAELGPDEREACQTLKDVAGWRCLSCEAEALACNTPMQPHRLKQTRSLSCTSEVLTSTAPASFGLARGITASVGTDFTLERVERRSLTCGAGYAKSSAKAAAKPPKIGRQPSLTEANRGHASFGEMLSHRAMRPIRTKLLVGNVVLIEAVGRGTAKASHLGTSGRVVEIFQNPEVRAKEDWCKVQVTDAESVMVPSSSVVCLEVPLRPGDLIMTFRAKVDKMGRLSAQPTHSTHTATILEIDKRKPHRVKVSFDPDDPDDTATVLLSWVLRAEMSAWTQVMRSAPHSTLLFLLADLHLSPSSKQDREELQVQITSAFEPHGRFRYIGSPIAEESPDSPYASENPTSSQKLSKQHMAVGECGKVKSFDLELFQVEVQPDRKKHLRFRVPLQFVEPDRKALKNVGSDGPLGPARMHEFDQDPDLLALVKKGDYSRVKSRLFTIPQEKVGSILLDDNVDVDGNTVFHAAAFTGKAEMWRLLWDKLEEATQVDTSLGDEFARALEARNDWDWTPSWFAIEGEHLELCSQILDSALGVSRKVVQLIVDQEVSVPPGDKSKPSRREFAGGPGLVAAGKKFKVTLYRPAASAGLRWGHPDPQSPARARMVCGDLSFVCTKTFGEAAANCVQPGDLLQAIGEKPASEFASFRTLWRYLDRAPRPVTLKFIKGTAITMRPLHKACEQGNADMIHLLLKNGANASWIDQCGRSAMDRVVRKKNRQDSTERAPFQRCVDLLAEYGSAEKERIKYYDCMKKPFETPAHWSQSPQMSVEGRFWLCVDDVSDDTGLMEQLQQMIDFSTGGASSKKKASRDRADGPAPRGLKIAKVQRVENLAGLREYLQHRDIMRRREQSSSYPMPSMTDLKVRLNYSKLIGKEGAASPLDANLNEVWLLHGTNPEGAFKIAGEDWDLQMAGSGAGSAFGAGIYFAEDAIKSDEYTQEAPAGHELAGYRPLLLCRVLLGRCLVAEEGEYDRRNVQEYVDEVMRGESDSILADNLARVGTFREWVVFDQNQATVEYIIWYQRVSHSLMGR